MNERWYVGHTYNVWVGTGAYNVQHCKIHLEMLA